MNCKILNSTLFIFVFLLSFFFYARVAKAYEYNVYDRWIGMVSESASGQCSGPYGYDGQASRIVDTMAASGSYGANYSCNGGEGSGIFWSNNRGYFSGGSFGAGCSNYLSMNFWIVGGDPPEVGLTVSDGCSFSDTWYSDWGLWRSFAYYQRCVCDTDNDPYYSCGQPYQNNCGEWQCAGSANCGPPPLVCGNSTCDLGEDCLSCPVDCGACPPSPTCPNGACDSGETCSTCPSDCGVCCGNGSCQSDLGETCLTCPSDCGACALPKCTPDDNPFQNSVSCGYDDPATNTPKTLVDEQSNCNGTKCQYYCPSGLTRVGDSCLPPEDGACGDAVNKTFCQRPIAYLCSKGEADNVGSSGNEWQWICKGSNGGDDSPETCKALKSCAYREVVPN